MKYNQTASKKETARAGETARTREREQQLQSETSTHGLSVDNPNDVIAT